MVSPKRVARSPRQIRPDTSPSRRPRGPRRLGDQVGGIAALLIVGALAGAGIVGLATGQTPSSTPLDSAAPTDDLGAVGSDLPEDTIAPVSPILEARMPTTVDTMTLTVQSAVDATNLSSGPDGRALNAAVVHLGKAASDLEIAYAYDESGNSDLVILGFRVDGVAAADVRAAVLSAWLAAGTPGVAATALPWSGAEVTQFSYGDDGADEYVLTIGDSVFVVETVDPEIAQSAVAALVGGPAASGATDAPQDSPSASPGT